MLKVLRNKKVHLVPLIVLVHLLFSYYYFSTFLSALAGTLLILILAKITWKTEYKYWLGIDWNKKDLLYSFGVFIVCVLIACIFYQKLAEKLAIRILPGNIKNFTHTLFYTLNEEIILGALLLKGIKSWSKKIPDWGISVGVALLFSLVHFVFFKWVFTNSANLGSSTLATLAFVGVFRNNLILRSGHIGFSWALHFAWIYIMLGSSHYNIAAAVFLNDFERFELYLGNPMVLMVSAGLALLSFVNWRKLLFSNKRHSIP